MPPIPNPMLVHFSGPKKHSLTQKLPSLASVLHHHHIPDLCH
jgi:hypothetical protein